MRHHIHLLILNKLNQRAQARYLKDPSLKNMAAFGKANNKLYQHKHSRGLHTNLNK